MPEGDNTAPAMKSVVVDPHAYDWEGDMPLRQPSSRTIIYEMHVRGFTHILVRAFRDNLRHLRGPDREDPVSAGLGITAVELLPVFQFDGRMPPTASQLLGLRADFVFRPASAYSSRQDPLGPVDEFRDMVKALHRAGIEVILDVVFNHTAEGEHGGPACVFAGSITPLTTSLSPTAPDTQITVALGTPSTQTIRLSGE